VRNLDATVASWRALGVTNTTAAEAHEAQVTYRGHPSTVRFRKASARLGTHTISWLQPLDAHDVFTDFLDQHGEGVHHIGFAAPSLADFERELGSFKQERVAFVEEGSSPGKQGAARFVYLDTASRGGGIVVELEFNPDAAPSTVPAAGTNDDPFNSISQYAFVVRDVKAVSDYWASLGLGGLSIERNVSLDRVYRGQPGRFEMLLGWGRNGDVPFEWIQPLIGPNVYEEYLRDHGEGFHHIGLNVSDMDGTLAKLQQRGLRVTMSGAWDVRGSQGRFAYLDSERYGGVTIELLWNKPRT
jgi:hypothetical protein